MDMEISKNWSTVVNDSLDNPEEDSGALMQINREKAELLIPAIIYTVVTMVLGSVGNPIAIYIYGWKWRSTTTRVFLFWLAVIDLINCIITMPTEIYVMTNFYYFPNASFCRMSRFITYVINNSSSAIFLAVALDRYIRICHPYRTAFSIFGAQLACAVSLCVGVGVSWPALVLYGSKVVPIEYKKENRSIKGIICDVKNDMDKTPYPFAFFIYLWCAFSVCVLLLSVMYSLIGRVMLRRRKNKSKNSNEVESKHLDHNGGDRIIQKDEVNELSPCDEDKELNSGDIKCVQLKTAAATLISGKIRPSKSTLMLFAITAVFVVSFLPFLIIMTIRQHFGESFYPSLNPTAQVAVNLLSRSYLVNNCANPIVYGLCNSQFRDQVRKLFRLSLKPRDSNLSREETWLPRGLTC